MRNTGRTDPASRLASIINRQTGLYPEMQPRDIYKLLFQAAMGSAHGVTGLSRAKADLMREIRQLSMDFHEPPVEEISPEGLIARVNLRPFAAAGHDPDRLACAFLETAGSFTGSRDRLAEYMNTVFDLSESGSIRLSVHGLRKCFREMISQGLPAVHHTDVYRNSYHPAYRVVASVLIPNITDR